MLLAGALFAGAASSLAWAPLQSPWLALTGYAVLTWLVLHATSARQAAAVALLFSFGLHGVGQHWLLAAMVENAGDSTPLAWLFGVGYLLYLGLFTAVPAAIHHRYSRPAQHRWFDALAWAALLTLGEWARSFGLNGLTALSIGHVFVNHWPAHWMPVAGLYGCGFLAFCSASLAGHMLFAKTRRKPAWPSVLRLLPALTLLWIGGLALRSVPWVQPDGSAISFRLLQGGIAQEHRFDTQAMAAQVDRYSQMIQSDPAYLIATPETAVALTPQNLPQGTWQQWKTFSQTTGSHVFIGLPSLGTTGAGHNSIFHLAPDTDGIERYDKVRLMPMGEYAPPGLGWLVERMRTPLKNLTPGEVDQKPVTLTVGIRAIAVAMMVCHEDQVGEPMRRRAASASLILNPTNLSWFEGTMHLQQSLQSAQVRALEAGRPVLRVGNTGITAQIDHQGRVVRQLPPIIQGALAGQVQPVRGLTPYVRWGDAVAITLAALTWLACRLFSTRARPTQLFIAFKYYMLNFFENLCKHLGRGRGRHKA
jgi:apolipoprotein N-acyltransferase